MRYFLIFAQRWRRWLIAFQLVALSCLFSFRFGNGLNGLFDPKWLFGGLLCGLFIVGLAVCARQAWILPPILKRTEYLWASGAPIAEILASSRPLVFAVGETGYRGLMLRSRAYFANGERALAAEEARSAHLARRPWWVRWSVRLGLRFKEHGHKWQESVLERIAPDLPEICWQGVLRAFARKNSQADAQGWQMLLECIPRVAHDTMFLEGCMLRALKRLELNQKGDRTPVSGPEARAVLERSMTLLVRMHNDPRLPWDRVKLAIYLQKEHRHAAVLVLCGELPPAYRPVDLWLVEARTWGALGDLSSAWAAIDSAVRVHPASYTLWMEAYRISMARRDGVTARRSLEQASRYIGRQIAGPARWEYELARSEYFFWVEGRTDVAWSHLNKVPEKYVESNRPKFTAQMLLSKKSFEEAYSKTSELLKTQPNDVDLRIMQSEAMAGMEAWEALLPHLESMGDDVRERAAYWHLKGLANKRLENHAQAREDFERAAWMESNNLYFVIGAGYACIDLGEYERSEQHWRRALKLDQHNREALLRLAEAREARRDTATAKSLLRECLLYHPDFQPAQEMLLRLESN